MEVTEDKLAPSLSTEVTLSLYGGLLVRCGSNRNPWTKGQKLDSRATLVPHWTCDPHTQHKPSDLHLLTCTKMERLMVVVLGIQPQNYLEQQVQPCLQKLAVSSMLLATRAKNRASLQPLPG